MATIHGAVGSILSGVPSFVFPTDARIRELVEYHNVPNMPASEVDENTDILIYMKKQIFTGEWRPRTTLLAFC
ncbi:MAG: hypothetical protein ACLR9J_09720 [Eubacterium sp.]